LGYGLDVQGSILGRVRKEFFLFTTISEPVLGPTKPPLHWVVEVLSLGVKWPGHKADHSPLPSTEVENAWSSLSLWHGA